MKKVLPFLLAAAVVSVAGLNADAAPGLLKMGRMSSSKDVTVVNLSSVQVVADSHHDGRGTWLKYGDRCRMKSGANILAVGRDYGRVLVRSRQAAENYIPETGYYSCSEDVIFWMDASEYAAAVQAYKKAEADEANRNQDKLTIRRLLDEELARK